MYEVAIIGAGPAGASAALFTAKAGKTTALIDNDKSMTKRAWIENHYGVMEITGPEMVEIGKKQAEKFGTTLVDGRVTSIEKQEDGFRVVLEEGEVTAKNVIIATGALTNLAESLGLETKEGTEPRIKTVFATDEQGKTNVPGIWAAGTAAGVSVHTIITAGDGAKVAINLVSELNGTRYVDHDVLK
ncbi:Pyridine nucleotide-disulphide oxidoreductase [Seinonella peptonophila]|uniref:Pyridine nucleotide-disulphide oxidoreductase n=1 Tax=Seinonella peptonophila TaxID=112248 RepID=A0A1M4W624_9BACL|nr:FAD-dependent oxidoreductase [Seinonella peptonophila]SHE76721.1 Pyridine nucleotide-disulphide oxidoreductase [Seinonella peptonophila]